MRASRADAMNSLQLLSITLSATLYFSFYHLNLWLFDALELHSGANWIFLPAGVRLLCTLLFAGEGALGLLLASLLISILHLGDSMDWLTGLVAAFISAGAPYLVYRLAQRAGMLATLQNLTAGRLSVLALAYAFANASLHSLWFALRGHFPDMAHGFAVMFAGDLIGTLIVVYAMKIALTTFHRSRQPD